MTYGNVISQIAIINQIQMVDKRLNFMVFESVLSKTNGGKSIDWLQLIRNFNAAIKIKIRYFVEIKLTK